MTALILLVLVGEVLVGEASESILVAPSLVGDTANQTACDGEWEGIASAAGLLPNLDPAFG